MSTKKAPASFAKRKQVLLAGVNDVTADHVFSLMSYNVLADCHTSLSTYPYRDSDRLDIKFRHKVLLEELRYSDCDVICLQEVGAGYFKDTLEPELQKLGYEGEFFKRTFERNDEGCATFFKSCKFTLQDRVVYKFGKIAEKVFVNEGENSPKSYSRYTDRCDVALVTLLRHTSTGSCLIIANTHLVWESAHISDVRCIQAVCCLVALEDFKQKHPENAGTVLCGDFNSVPTDPAYELLVSGGLGEENMKVIESGNHITMDTMRKIVRELPESKSVLRSAYKTVTGAEPKITNLDGEFCLCLDYVFFEPRSDISGGRGLGILAVLDFLSEEEMRQNLPPSEVFPSDHLPLIATFSLK